MGKELQDLKMMVEEELQHYDTAVTRTTPTVEMMDSRMNTLERRQQAREDLSVTPLSMVSGVSVPGWNTPQDILEQCKQKYEVDQAFEQLVAESSSQQTASMVQSSQVQSSSMVTSSSKTMTAAGPAGTRTPTRTRPGQRTRTTDPDAGTGEAAAAPTGEAPAGGAPAGCWQLPLLTILNFKMGIQIRPRIKKRRQLISYLSQIFKKIAKFGNSF